MAGCCFQPGYWKAYTCRREKNSQTSVAGFGHRPSHIPIAIKAKDVQASDIANPIIVPFNANDIKIMDASYQFPSVESGDARLPSVRIYDDEVVIICNKQIQDGMTWNGLITLLCFEAKVDGQTAIHMYQ